MRDAKRMWALGCGLALAVAACGESDSTGSPRVSSGGASGADSGGSGGSSSGTGGGDTGGASGSGTSGAAGTGTGGTADTGGTAGTGGLAHVSDCDGYCADAAAANCSNFGTHGECVVGCVVLTERPECEPFYVPFFECAEAATMGCNADGNVVPLGCEGIYSTALACAYGTGPDPALQQPCEDYCTEVIAAGCPGNSEYDGCVAACTLAGTEAFNCGTEWGTFLTCSETSPISCNAQGNAVIDNCIVQYLVYVGCVLAGDPSGAGGAAP